MARNTMFLSQNEQVEGSNLLENMKPCEISIIKDALDASLGANAAEHRRKIRYRAHL